VATRVPELSWAAELRGTCVVRKDGAARCGRLPEWRFEAVEAAQLEHPPRRVEYFGGLCTIEHAVVVCRSGTRSKHIASEIDMMAATRRGLVLVRDDGAIMSTRICGQYRDELCLDPLAEMRSRAVTIEQAGSHTCVLARDGRVWCELACTEATCKEPGFVAVAGVEDATQLAVGLDHACALRTGGTVVCWGESRCGQAGGGVQAGDECARVRTQVHATTIAWAK
jgi:hypothetical protein